MTASSVLPTAMPSELNGDPAVVMLTRKAPMKIAGATR